MEGAILPSSILTENFLHKPPGILQRRIHSPADLPQPERPARAFGAEPGGADPLPSIGRVVGRQSSAATYFLAQVFLQMMCADQKIC